MVFTLRDLIVWLIAGLGVSAIAATPALKVVQTSSVSQPDPIAQKLLGTWQQQDFLPASTVIVFGENGKLILLTLTESGTFATPSTYKVDSNPQPMHLDLATVDGAIPMIFDFMPDGRLRTQAARESPGNSKPPTRPSTFTADAVFYQKVSNSTTLLLDPQAFARRVQASRSPESEARLIMDAMTRAQQAYRLEHAAFASTVAQLKTAIKPETENYQYEIMPQGDGTQRVKIVGRAKRPELKSFTGAVFKPQLDNQYEILLAVVCETFRPSQIAPAMPDLADPGATYLPECPADSQPVNYLSNEH